MKTPFNDTNSMKALVYGSPGLPAWEVKPKPVIKETTDAIVRATMTTVCGTDLHILKWDVSTVTNSRILDHEGIGKVGEQENRCH